MTSTRHRVAFRWILAGLSLVAAGCTPATPVSAPAIPNISPWFEDVSEKLGLAFRQDPGSIDETYFMPQIVGSGGAFLDFNGDGKLDILLLQNAGPKSQAKHRLFRQSVDGQFQDVSSGSGLDVAGFGMGVAVGDVNNDGRPDVFITEFGSAGRLFLNQPDSRFKEYPNLAGVPPLWGTAASFLDYDRDGFLDLVVVHYVDLDSAKTCGNESGKRDYCSPNVFQGSPTRLYRNRGVDAEANWLGFEDRTVPAGLHQKLGAGLGVLCADLSGDGWPDILVANDGHANHLWVNQKNGQFLEEAVGRGLAFNGRGEPQANMGIAYGDIHGQGLPSLFITHLTWESHGLWKQGPRGMFQETAPTSGITRASWRGTGFGTAFADFDLDGKLDLAIVNGRVSRAGNGSANHWEAYAERNQVFTQEAPGTFRDISSANPALCEKPNVARGLAVADFDQDGAPDLLVTQIAGPAKLYRNITKQRGHWLSIRVSDATKKRDAIGAEVRVVSGNRTWYRLVQPSYSYLSGNDPTVHFGLGSVDRIEAIEVLWPDGREERFVETKIDRVLEIVQGKGESLRK